MLNVTALLWPSHPKSPSNWAIMGTTYAPQTDFRADIWMGWEPGDRPHRLGFHVLGPQGQGMASFGFRNESAFGPGPQIFAGASGLGSSSPAPAAGIHQFTITRTGTQFEFYLNGDFFASFHDLFGTPAWGISLEFLGPYPGQFGAFHVDRVAMVPSPGAMMISFALALWSAERGRR